MWSRRLWPLSPAPLLVPALSFLLVDAYDASSAQLVLLGVVPTVLAALLAGRAVGGRRGALLGAALLALAAYWAWWFGWGVDSNISPLSLDLAGYGLIDAAQYHLGLLITLWPLVLLVGIAVAILARRRGSEVWNALGALTLLLVVLAFPRDAAWDDGCNGGSGASPLITKPVAEPLMDIGIGVLPSQSMTMKGCLDLPPGDPRWKPFWLGPDHLPATRGITAVLGPIRLPERLYRLPHREPGGRIDDIVVWHDRSLDQVHALVRISQPLPARVQVEPYPDLRLDGDPFDDTGELSVPGKRGGWCSEFVWVGTEDGVRRTWRQGRRRTPLRVTFRHHGRWLGAGRAPVRDRAPAGRPFGCPRTE